jgi:hypothetical protein
MVALDGMRRKDIKHSAEVMRDRGLEPSDRAATRIRGVTAMEDGVGIDCDVLGRGTRPGHSGLQGVRERAEALRGHFRIRS